MISTIFPSPDNGNLFIYVQDTNFLDFEVNFILPNDFGLIIQPFNTSLHILLVVILLDLHHLQ